MNISACLIVKNEERCLARCIESFKNIVSEIIVVDTGSTDKSVEIAESFGAKIFHFNWINDFAAARNYALDKVSGGWVIFLDADEYFRPGDDENIVKYIKKANTLVGTKALLTYMHNVELGEDQEADANNVKVTSQSIRVFRNLPDIRFEGKIHESLQAPDKKILSIRVPLDDICVIHDGYAMKIVKEKGSRNLDLLLEDEKNGAGIPLTYYYILQEYYNFRQYDKALKYAYKFIDCKRFVEYIGLRGHVLASNCITALKRDPEELKKLALDARRDYPADPAAATLAGNYYYECGAFEKALKEYQRAELLLGSNPMERMDYYLSIGDIRHSQTLERMGSIRELKGEPEKAKKDYAKAADINLIHRSAMDKLARLFKKDSKLLIEYLDAHFDTTNEKVLYRIVIALSKYKPGLAFLHYFEKFYDKTKIVDVYMYIMFQVIGEHERAFDAYLKDYIKTKKLSMACKAHAAALITGREDLIRKLYEEADGDYREFIDAYSGEDQDIDEKHENIYLFILKELLNFTEPASLAVRRWFDFAGKFKAHMLIDMARVLFNCDYNAEALSLVDLFLSMPENTHTKDAVLLGLQISYQEGGYEKAREYFSKAKDFDIPKPLLENYKEWLEAT